MSIVRGEVYKFGRFRLDAVERRLFHNQVAGGICFNLSIQGLRDNRGREADAV